MVGTTRKKTSTTKKKPAKKITAKKTVAKKSTAATKKVKTSAAQKPAAKKKTTTAKRSVAAKKKTTTKKIVAKKKSTTVRKPVAKKESKKKVTTKARQKPTVKKVQVKVGETVIIAGKVEIQPYKVKRGEEYMNETQLYHFETILVTRKQGLMEEVDRTVSHMKHEAANFPDPNDRASQEEEFNLELRTRDRERKLIKKIEETLERIKINEYGYCDACGVEIGVRRLEARPTATLCIDCKTLDEIRERQESV